MEYSKLFKTLLGKAEDKGSFLAEVPYRRASPICKSAPEGLPALGANESLFVMTDSGVDREGDVISSPGVDVEQFRQFGSVLWGHRADKPEFVLGAPADVMKEETRILVRAAFSEEDHAQLVLRMIRAGVVRAMSVGIMIEEFSEANDRGGFMPLNIMRSELIETSVTPVPVNPRAVELATGGSAEAEKAAKDLFEEAAETEEQLEASAAVTSLTPEEIKSLVLETIKELDGDRVMSVPSTPNVKDSPDVFSYLARQAAQRS
jgi:hypothetical protein